MTDQSKQVQPWGFLHPLLVLGGMLAVLFVRSFKAHLILFANDGPFGAISAEHSALPAAFYGIWGDLNWVGAYGGSALVDFTYLILFLFKPLGFAKFHTPLSLLILGLSAWLFARQFGFRPVVCTLCSLAAAFNADLFSHACWGLGTHSLAVASIFLALAALVTPATERVWLKASLAGMAVGMAVVEGFDNGAILSLYIAAFVCFQVWMDGGPAVKRITKAVGRLALVAGTRLSTSFSTRCRISPRFAIRSSLCIPLALPS